MDNVVQLEQDDTRTDVQKAFDNYNVIAESVGIPKARFLPPHREVKLKKRLAEVGLAGWNEALGNLETSSFLRGDNDRGWKADFDFMLQPVSLLRVLEGFYSG